MQLDKLRRQLAYVVDRSPFYARKFADAGFDASRLGNLDDLRHAPFTTKDELRESQIASPPLGDYAAADLRDVIRVHSSSGTTGRPSYVGITRHDRDTWTETVSRVYCVRRRAARGRRRAWLRPRLLRRRAAAEGRDREHRGDVHPDRHGRLGPARHEHPRPRWHGSTCTPSTRTTWPSTSAPASRSDPSELGLQRILLGAEPGGAIPAVRERLAEEFGAFVTERLGNADLVPVYAGNCDELDGNHFLAPDSSLLELIDPDSGEPLGFEDGAEGELVATHLERECVPLVRFRVRDRVLVKTLAVRLRPDHPRDSSASAAPTTC